MLTAVRHHPSCLQFVGAVLRRDPEVLCAPGALLHKYERTIAKRIET